MTIVLDMGELHWEYHTITGLTPNAGASDTHDFIFDRPGVVLAAVAGVGRASVTNELLVRLTDISAQIESGDRIDRVRATIFNTSGSNETNGGVYLLVLIRDSRNN